MGTFNSVKNIISNKYLSMTPFQISGIGAILLSILLLFVNIILALVPLILFVLLCAASPFMTKSGFFLPVISRGDRNKNAVSLTFDDGPHPDVTPALLRLLAKYSAKATFFVTGENTKLYPDIIKKIIAEGHAIGNHSYKHDPLLMLRRKKNLYNEIKFTQNILNEFGITPLAFRPPAGITNPRLRPVLQELGMYCINWSLRALDTGNRKINGLAKKILKKVKTGDIILLHDSNPNGIDTGLLLNEIEQVLIGLKKSGLLVKPLYELTGKDVMKNRNTGKKK